MYSMHPVPYCRTDINLRQLSFLKMFLVSYVFSFTVANFSGNRHDELLQLKTQFNTDHLCHEAFSQSRVLSKSIHVVLVLKLFGKTRTASSVIHVTHGITFSVKE